MSATTERARAAAVLVTSIAMLALPGAFSASARAGGGVTNEQLQAAGWICYVPPGSIDRIVCFDPGVWRPFPGNPDPAPSYDYMLFTSSGAFLYTGHFIRADLYSGQRCGKEPYVFRALIGYWECAHD
jgi:hypothetical protein